MLIDLQRIYELNPFWFEDRIRLRSALFDLYPRENLEVNSLMAVYDLGIASQIKNSKEVDGIKIERWIAKVQQEYGLERRIAESAVKNWINCFCEYQVEGSTNSANATINRDTESKDGIDIKSGDFFGSGVCMVCESRLEESRCPICGWEYKQFVEIAPQDAIKYMTKSIRSGEIEITSIFIENKEVKEIVVPSEIDGNTVIGIDGKAFKNLGWIESVVLPQTAVSLGEKIFQNCTRLKNVVLPNTVRCIPKRAFDYCIALEEIVLPDSVEIIEEAAFKSCRKLKRINGMENVIVIKDYSFQKCSSLEEFTVPRKVKQMGKGVFQECFSLSKFTFNQLLEYISEEMFINCKKLQTMQIPLTIKTIGRGAFRECSSMEKIIISSDVKSIGDEAFLSCVKLKMVYILNGQCRIGKHVFDMLRESKGNATTMEWTVRKLDGSPDYRYNPIIHRNKNQSLSTMVGMKGITIYCNRDSEVEQYALKRNIKVEYIG